MNSFKGQLRGDTEGESMYNQRNKQIQTIAKNISQPQQRGNNIGDINETFMVEAIMIDPYNLVCKLSTVNIKLKMYPIPTEHRQSLQSKSL